MVHINAVSSIVPTHRIGMAEMSECLARRAPAATGARLRRMLDGASDRLRYTVLPLEQLERLGGSRERDELYRRHATELAERAVARLDDAGTLHPRTVSTVIFVSSTGSTPPSLDTHLVRRFGLSPRCRRIALTQLGCGGGVAAVALAAERAARDPDERVLVVAVEIPSLQLQLGEPSYHELRVAADFGDGAAAALLSHEGSGPAVLATESRLLPETEEGGRVVPCESGLRLVASAGLPTLVRDRVRVLVDEFVRRHEVDPAALQFLLVHPRGEEVLDAVRDGLAVEPRTMAASCAAWERGSNMISASIYRALAHLACESPPLSDAPGLLIAFGTGVACEMVLLRWSSAPTVS